MKFSIKFIEQLNISLKVKIKLNIRILIYY